MALATFAYNGTTAFLAAKGVSQMALNVMLLTDDGNFNAAHQEIHEVANGSKSAVTLSVATPGKVNWTGHGLAANDRVLATTTGALLTGLTAGTWYFVRNPGADDFELSLTSGGASIAFSGTQSGVHTFFAIKASTGYEVWGNGWAAGGTPLTSVAVTTVTTNDALVNAATVSVTASGGQIGYAYAHVFYDRYTGRVLKHTEYNDTGPWRAGDGTPYMINILSGLFTLNLS